MERIHYKMIAILGALILILTACAQSTEAQWQEQYDLGVRYLSDGNYEEAIIAFTAAIKIDPNRAEAYVGRGDAYIGSGETEDNLAAAEADYEEAIALDETDTDAYLGLADVYIRRGEYDRALEILTGALEVVDDTQRVSNKIAEIESGNIYDSSGNARRTSGFDGNGTLLWYHELTYDRFGRNTAVISYDSSGTQTGHVDIEYDENGNMLNSPGYNFDDGIVWNGFTYSYNSNGSRSQEARFDRNGELEYYEIFYYNEFGTIIRGEFYDKDNVYFRAIEYQYDSEEKLIRRTQLDADGSISSYQLYEYDAQNRLVRVSLYYNHTGLDSYTVYIYNEADELVSMELYDGQGNVEYVQSSAGIDSEALLEALTS